ncbi:MAG: hypothetical protein ACTSU7_00290 [Candidatus Heimdallarchaeaceae archaeon]
MVKKPTYSKLIGAKKSFKNIVITYAIPIALVLINTQAEWLPAEYALTAAPFLGMLSYFVKNYLENK